MKTFYRATTQQEYELLLQYWYSEYFTEYSKPANPDFDWNTIEEIERHMRKLEKHVGFDRAQELEFSLCKKVSPDLLPFITGGYGLPDDLHVIPDGCE